jgi:hypothetical protein
VDATTAAIVSQVRAWMHCSRVSLLRRRGGRCRLLAVSDLEDFDRRSEAVRSLERLAAQVVQDGRAHLQEGRSGPGAAASSTQEQFPRDEGRPWLLAVVPLPPPAQEPMSATGALIVEDFDEAAVWSDERRTRLQLAAVHAVAANDVLVQLRSPRLAQERAELEGQRRTTEQQIADLAALRGGREPRGEGRPLSQAELAARQEELNSVLESLDGQLAALARHEQELTVRSPIAGRVLTWNVEQLLQGRPVLAGQRLLSVADVAGPWIAEVRVPDRDIAHVQAARQNGQPVRVSLLAATDLNTRRVGAVTDIARVVTHDPLEGPVVVVTVAVEAQPGFDARPGATVYPRIHCGRRSLGYVWFRRLYETVASWAAL